MTNERIAIRITPTPASQNISSKNLARLAKIAKMTPEAIEARISRGKGITLVTQSHPKLKEVVQLIKSFGFSVVMGHVAEKTAPSTSGPNLALTFPKPATLAGVETKTSKTSKTDQDIEWRIGELIENLYEVRDIKHGGMGAVYVVYHKRWNTMMAVKSLLRRLQDSKEDKALFLKEAETWIDIGFHPNIAACYYVRNILDSPRIFIEYVDGGSLNHWLLEHGPASWEMLIDLMVQFSDGLAHAHDKGLVHRDIKPGNCMMTKDGILKVTDFGLTKRQRKDTTTSRDPDASLPGDDYRDVTAAGMGTPGYMAPEMWFPKAEVGPPADVYAFGVMFFELCCGRKPFFLRPGEKRDKLALAHVRETPPLPSSLRADIPKPIEELILKCLRKHPDERYQSFRTIRDELASIYESVCKKPFTREAPDELKLRADALNNRAVSQMDLNHREEAEAALLAALEADPNHPEAVYNKGLLEWLRTGNPGWDLVVRLEEIAKTPEYQGRAGYLVSRCLLTLGDPVRACKASETALSSGDVSEEWLKPYAVALIGMGKDAEAIEHLDTYLKDVSNDDEARGWLIAALARAGRTQEAQTEILKLSEGSAYAGLSLETIVDTFTYSGLEPRLVLKGHSAWITCVTHFPTSPLLMTAARDRTIRVWDAHTGNQVKVVSVVGEAPVALRISPDERLLAVVTAQKGAPVKIMDLVSGKFVGSLSVSSSVTDLGFSADSTDILTVEPNGSVRVWSAENFKVVGSYKVPAHTAAAWVSKAGGVSELFLVGMDRLVKRVTVKTGEISEFEPAHRDPILLVRVTPDGTRVLTAGRDKKAIIWHGIEGWVVSVFEVHDEFVASAAINPLGTHCATYDPKAGIKFWDVHNGMVVRTFSGDGEVLCLAFSPDGRSLLVGGKNHTVCVYDVGGMHVMPGLSLAKIRSVTKQLKSDKEFRDTLEAAKQSLREGSFEGAYRLLRQAQRLPGYERSDAVLDLLLRMKDRGVRKGLHRGWMRKSMDAQAGVRDVVFSPSGIYFLTAHADHTIRLWGTKIGGCTKVLKGHTNLVSSVRFSVNGQEAASGGDDRIVRIWDLNSGKNVLTLKGHTESVSVVAYRGDGTCLASASWDGTIRLWRMPEGTLLKILKGHEDKVDWVEMITGTDFLVSCGFDGVVKMWELSSGRSLRDLRGHKGRVRAVRVSPMGDLLLSVSLDGTARVWDVKRGQCLKVLEAGSGLRAAAFSPDQQFFITGGVDGLVKLWNLPTGECLREFSGHPKEITAVDFASNGRYALSASSDGTIILWELDWEWQFKTSG